jgi:hypothetical protein
MNVDGSCGTATCYSSNVTFTVANQGQQTSAALAVSLSNTTNFEFVSNTCTGATLAQGANCLVVVRAKNTGNGSYTGTLQITANDNPFAILQGTSSNFACAVGRAAPGGYYVSCNVGGLYDLVTDFPIRSWRSWGRAVTGYVEDTNGAQTTANYMSYTADDYPAISYCGNLVYGGKDDWYLPSRSELITYVRPNLPSLPGYSTTNRFYWTSTENSPASLNTVWMVEMPNLGAYTNIYTVDNLFFALCLRREGQAFPSAQADSTPAVLTFADVTGTNGVRTASATAIVSGINQAVAATISGTGGSPTFKVNGGAEVASATVSNGDIIQLVGTPTTGTTHTITITIGGVASTWSLAAPGLSGYFVVTNGLWDGNLGGNAGADAKCLSDLTANDWLGKTDATTRSLLNSTNVKAFLCTYGGGWECSFPTASTVYYFAVSGDATKGGASFTTTSGSNGPNDSNAWSGATYFNGTKEYWTNHGVWAGTQWAYGPDATQCSLWASNSSAVSGNMGLSTSTAEGRWKTSIAGTCDQARRLICLVNP